MPVSTREHRDIIDRIAAGDVEGAGRALRAHVNASRERMHKSRAAVHMSSANGRHHLAVIPPKRQR
jgi:DNA-binding GntR family transcriptional regulator